MTPPPGRVVSPRLTSPSTHNHHYYNSLRKYQLDTLPAGGGGRKEGVDGGRVVEIQVHSNHKTNGGTITNRQVSRTIQQQICLLAYKTHCLDSGDRPWSL